MFPRRQTRGNACCKFWDRSARRPVLARVTPNIYTAQCLNDQHEGDDNETLLPGNKQYISWSLKLYLMALNTATSTMSATSKTRNLWKRSWKSLRNWNEFRKNGTRRMVKTRKTKEQRMAAASRTHRQTHSHWLKSSCKKCSNARQLSLLRVRPWTSMEMIWMRLSFGRSSSRMATLMKSLKKSTLLACDHPLYTSLFSSFFYSSDYVHVDDDFWDQEFGESPRPKRGRRALGAARERSTGIRRGTDRESILARYKIMQVQVQDRNGNYFMIKKKVRQVLSLASRCHCVSSQCLQCYRSQFAHLCQNPRKADTEIVGSYHIAISRSKTSGYTVWITLPWSTRYTLIGFETIRYIVYCCVHGSSIAATRRRTNAGKDFHWWSGKYNAKWNLLACICIWRYFYLVTAEYTWYCSIRFPVYMAGERVVAKNCSNCCWMGIQICRKLLLDQEEYQQSNTQRKIPIF